MPRGGWEKDSQYQFSESNANPKFRPSVDKLLTKLRTLSILQNDPAVVEVVIDDLIHYYLVREKPRPGSLFQLLMKVNRYWMITLGGEERIPTPPLLSPPLSPPLLSPLLSPSSLLSPPPFSAEREAIEDLISKHILFIDVDNENVIFCGCHLEFSSGRRWARHLYIQIWNYLKESS